MADFSIAKFSNYQEYLQSFTTVEDYRYLPFHKTVVTLTKLGYREHRTFYMEDEFLSMKKQVEQLLNPTVSAQIYYSQYFKGTDPALRALVERETYNVQQEISTIIFLETSGRSGFAKSGYIDFEASLRNCRFKGPNAVDWRAVFEEKKMLKPQPSDIVFYDWKSRKIFSNDNDNYTVVAHPEYGLMFAHKGDHKNIPVTTKKNPFSSNVKRSMIRSNLYGFIILYDHYVRKKT
ncbi:cilia- and flagella-associated protein 299 [Drosophila eugracilis]|uniref:cilia- and flagella-associated protein 299 n=1 Tax=Drosophila eugracilis TaxID=29029 RepID=UPI001BD9DC09|nr:cilia- and flagella-associated protein 299 [Drosophila eugracilis]